MEQAIFVSFIITGIYIFIRYVEAKYMNKTGETKPLRVLVRDGAIVFVSCLVGSLVFFSMDGTSIGEFMNTITETKTIASGAPQVFTDAPGF